VPQWYVCTYLAYVVNNNGEDTAEVRNFSLTFSVIAKPNAIPELGTRNLDGGKSEYCYPTTAIMATM
jgi:hypothetical protein